MNFLAVSSLSWQGLPPAQGRPADEQTFSTLQAARDWLRELRCGGTISWEEAGQFRSETIAPG